MSQHHEQPTYPAIDPTTFDLVVVGTGLPESVLAAAASAAGKTVLHLDPNPFYGSHSSSLSLCDLSSFLTSSLPVYSGVEISPSPSPPELEGLSGKFLLDVSGPRALFCADRAVDLLVRSGASNYVEFKGVDASFVFLEGRLCKVPDSRAAIFKDRELGLREKNQLMRFYKLVQTHLGSGSVEEEEEEEEEGGGKGRRISDVDLETPFVDFLSKMKLPPNIKSGSESAIVGIATSLVASVVGLLIIILRLGFENSYMVSKPIAPVKPVANCSPPCYGTLAKLKSILRPDGIHWRGCVGITTSLFVSVVGLLISIILYAISMADYDQEDKETCKDLLYTKDGIDRLALYQSSVGRFSNTPGAMIYPIYGLGELPQAFCRRAAVKGCIYVLRMPVTALLTEEDGGCYKGVRLASGQEIYSRNLILDPSFKIPSHLVSPSDQLHERLHFNDKLGAQTKVARGICITRGSLKQDTSNLFAVFPPRSLFSEQVTSVRALQISGNLAVCPQGMFVLYLSALCDQIHEGKKLLNSAIDAILSSPDSDNPENSEDLKPTILWRALYIQDLTTAQFGPICSAPMPDGHLSHNNLLHVATELFQKLYPGEEFFPEIAMPEDSDD